MTALRALPMCCMCGKGSSRLVQTLNGTFLLCADCEPPTAAGPPVVYPHTAQLDVTPARTALVSVLARRASRFKLPPLPPRRFKLPPLPKRAEPVRRVVAAQPRNTVTCLVDYTYAQNESGNDQECVIVECGECEHVEQSWGHGDKSVRRCLVLMGQHCPEGEENFYILERD